MKGKELTPRIGIFGRRNYGKSSLINYLTGQSIAIVSDTPGTTTDPVRKTMEISGVGPVVWVDTAGIDDGGTLGALRVQKSYEALAECDLALLLFAHNRFEEPERALLAACRRASKPFLLLYSQSDVTPPDASLLLQVEEESGSKVFCISLHDESLREALSRRIREVLPENTYRHTSLLGDVIAAGDVVVMVTPIDASAPEGRMILPQVQVLRDILDHNAIATVCKETELQATLASLGRAPRLVVTDSQVFGMVAQVVPQDVFLTSFSVVLARAKGLFDNYVQGTPAIDTLRDGDRVLLLESCTHTVSCEDIGRVKLPRLLSQYTGKQLEFEMVTGQSQPLRPITDYRLVIQCGGCVASRQQLASRLAAAIDAGIPVSNYGLALAYLNGIFRRAMQIFNNN